MKMNGEKREWFLVILLILCVDRHLSEAQHHPYCEATCSGIRLRAVRASCLRSCDQDVTGVLYREGRGVLPYLRFDPATLIDDAIPDERDDVNRLDDAFEIPVNDVLFREPRDRSTFVRIGKRDVSAVLNPEEQKRRDEFVRIGKGAKHGNRSPFLLGRSYTVQGRVHGARPANSDEEAKMAGSAADETLLIPIADAIKRPSAFVRIGKRHKDDVRNDDASAGSLVGVYGKAVAPIAVHTHQTENGRSAEGNLSGPDETELEKKAAAFVRIGRRGAAFVRIGKYDPNTSDK